MAALAALGVTVFTSGKASGQRSGFDPEEKTIAEMQAAMRNGHTTSAALTAWYIARIRTLDKKTNSIIEINPDALNIARELDRERKAGKVRGPLHGIPIVLKDNIDTADRMKTTAGSLALENDPTPARDASLAEQLRNAGAVILAKTTSANGRISATTHLRAVGRAAAGRHATRTSSIAIRAALHRVRRWR